MHNGAIRGRGTMPRTLTMGINCREVQAFLYLLACRRSRTEMGLLKSLAASSVAVLGFLGLESVDAHGYIAKPAAHYRNSYTKTFFNKVITQSVNPAFQGRKWNDSPQANTHQFTEAFSKSGYATLREMLDAVASDCGNSRLDVPPVDVHGMDAMQFQNDEYREGFISSHHGPCEVWIDDHRVFESSDCRAQFPSYPAFVPVNYGVCRGECVLRFYWLALHEPDWQVYKQCVPIASTNPSRTRSLRSEP